MQSITLEIPPNIASRLKLPPKKAKQILMEELVLKLYEEGIITSLQGASLLKMTRIRFELFLAEHEIPIHDEPEELEKDLVSLKTLSFH